MAPRVTLSGVSGLGTLLSGNYIGLQPGKSTKTQRHFTGLDEAPVVPDQPGKMFRLKARDLGSLGIGADALAAADAHAPPACVAATTVLPDPAQCLRGYGFEPAVGRGDRAETTLAALYKRVGTHMDSSQFAEATQVLDCAEAVAGAHPSAAVAQELARRRGVLEFRRECPLQALNWFKRALAQAERSEKRRHRRGRRQCALADPLHGTPGAAHVRCGLGFLVRGARLYRRASGTARQRR